LAPSSPAAAAHRPWARRTGRRAWVRGPLACALTLAVATALPAQDDRSADGLALQKARATSVVSKGKKAYYTKKWDLGGLPAYVPTRTVTGTIRLWGSNYIVDGNLGQYWEDAFRKFHPGVTFEYHMKTTIAAVPSLVFGLGDIGVGRKITFAEMLMFERYKDYDPIELSVATGSYDVTGWQPGFGIVVNKANPLTRLTMEQLDGIFGAERLGGWVGTSWHAEFARGPEKNIRTWGQLGLTGEWASQAIIPYGLNLRYHQSAELSDRLLKGSDKWNERLRIYANSVSADGKLGRGLNEDLVKDRYGIAYIAAPTKRYLPPELKVLELAANAEGPYYAYTMENLRNRTYPLYDEIYMYADQKPGEPLDPKVKEYLRFVVSREGQAEVMRDGKYLPLTAEVAREQMQKLQERPLP
jgi:phosphate transport system substrate-binding protein